MSSDTVLLEYVGNVVMEDGKMKYLLVDGGYIDFTSGTPVYMYYFKDHLGSNRVVASQSGSVEQVNHYYPYGLSFPLDSHTSSGSDSSGPSAGGDDQPWKYSGNELMSLGGLSVYDFNARTYDQSLGRFLSIDPLAENYYSVSPYAFCSNNPVNFVDPDGERWVDRNGQPIWDNGNWTEYASEEQMKVANVMRSTLTGAWQFAKLVRSKYDITVTIDELSIPASRNGGTLMGNTKKRLVGGKVTSMEIILYKKNASMRPEYMTGKVDLYESMAVNLGHEIEHTTEEAVQLTENNASVEETEEAPTRIGQMLKDELGLPVLNLFVFEKK